MLRTGAPLKEVNYPTLTQEDLNAYALASGDMNPIHLDAEAAKRAGLPGVIAHGMLIAAYLSEAALEFSRNNPDLVSYDLQEFQTRFKAMVLLGDELTIRGSVRRITDSSVLLELQCTNQRAETTTTALATFKKMA